MVEEAALGELRGVANVLNARGGVAFGAEDLEGGVEELGFGLVWSIEHVVCDLAQLRYLLVGMLSRAIFAAPRSVLPRACSYGFGALGTAFAGAKFQTNPVLPFWNRSASYPRPSTRFPSLTRACAVSRRPAGRPLWKRIC